MASTPVAIGMTVCDYMIVEEDTKKVSLIGSFSVLRVPAFPATAPDMAVYALLTGGQGNVTVEVKLARLDTLAEVIVDRFPLHFLSKLAEIICSTRLRGLLFPVPGYYQFTLLVDGEWVAQKRLRIDKKED